MELIKMDAEMDRVIKTFEMLCDMNLSENLVTKSYDVIKDNSPIFNATLLAYAVRMYKLNADANEKMHMMVKDFLKTDDKK
jgi:hypothetical protein